MASGGQTNEFDSAESWEAARNYAALLGEVPNSFSTLVRSLVNDVEVAAKNGQSVATLSDASRFQVNRLLKGPSVRAVILYAALSFFPERIQSANEIDDRELIGLFDPLHLAAVIATTYLYRTARKRNKADEWGHLAQQLHPHVELGSLVGAAIPNIHPFRGMFVGALPFIAQATFLKHDARGFTEYRRMIKKSGFRMEPTYEIQRWGCTTVQVASILLQAVGFGVTVSGYFTQGLSPAATLQSLDTEPYRFKIADTWIEGLLSKGTPPDIAHRGDFYPLAKDLEKLISRVAEVRRTGCKYLWLEKGKDDIAPEGGGSEPESDVAEEDG